MICSDCGQKLPDSGICYNCKKNLDDANRFGRGSGTLPAYIKYGPHGSTHKTFDPGPKRKTREQRKPVVKSSSGNKRKRRRAKRVPRQSSVKTKGIAKVRSRRSKKKKALYLGRNVYWVKSSKKKTSPYQERGTSKKKSRTIPKTYAPMAFPVAIIGEWVNLQTKETVVIEDKIDHWHLRKKASKGPPQKWSIVRLARNRINFVGRTKTISAHIGAHGTLVLEEGGRRVPFAALVNGQWYRICSKCFATSPWQVAKCRNCCKRFDLRHSSTD